MNQGSNLNKQSLTNLLNKGLVVASRYVVLVFTLVLVGVYGFVAIQVYLARNAQPSEADITAQEQAATKPHIDQTVVSQIQSLQDHSVNVKTLFDQARNNPFQE